MDKRAETDREILSLLAERWSPLAFAPRTIPDEALGSLMEAARWAPSCFNDQPWFFMVARRQDGEEFARMLDCLVEGNRVWAHDLGLAVGSLLVQATAMGLNVHQMGGFDPAKTRESYGIPEGFEPMTAIAIGYRDDPSTLSEAMREREMQPRERKPLSSFFFSGRWDSPAGF